MLMLLKSEDYSNKLYVRQQEVRRAVRRQDNMAKHGGGYRRGGNGFFKSRRTTKVTKKMDKHIRSVVAMSTAIVVRNPRTDPRPYKPERSMKRVIRLVFGAEDDHCFMGRFALQEASGYGLAQGSVRWNRIKPLAMTFWGQENNVDINVTLAQLASSQGANQPFSDSGDRNHRACIKLIFPPTTQAILAQNSDALAGWVKGTIHMVDLYCECF